MTSLSGCVLPVGPRFEDPPTVENFAPAIEGAQPAQGSVVTAVGTGTGTTISQTFTIMFTDPNAGDDLYVRWIGEYPPYSATSHVLSDNKISHSVNGEPLHQSASLNVTCFTLLARTAQHQITVLVSDRPYWDPSDPAAPLNLEMVLVQNTEKTLVAQATWFLNLPCQ
jgi:hypothetical protein